MFFCKSDTSIYVYWVCYKSVARSQLSFKLFSQDIFPKCQRVSLRTPVCLMHDMSTPITVNSGCNNCYQPVNFEAVSEARPAD